MSLNKKAYLMFCMLALPALASAVVIAPPVVYWVTLSLSTFIANMMVTLFMYAAVRGIASKKLFGRAVSNVVGFALSMAGKFIIALIASLAALVAITPITVPELLVASAVSVAIALALSFLSGYREIRVSEDAKKAAASIIIFSLLVGCLTFASAYFSLQSLPAAQAPQLGPGQKAPSYAAGAQSAAMKVEKPSEAPSQQSFAPAPPINGTPQGALDYSQELEQVKPSYTTIYILPVSGEPCVVSSAGQTKSFIPRFECVSGQGLSQTRVYCPIAAEVAPGYTTAGSCA